MTEEALSPAAEDRFNIVWLNGRGGSFAPALQQQLLDIGVGEYAAALMAAKGDFYALKADGLSAPAANILKQEFLAKGAECAVHREVILGRPEQSSVIMLATARQYQHICRGLARQQFGLPQLGAEVDRALRNIRRESWRLRLRDGRELALSTDTAVMGILNLTPDSFSDGGENTDIEQAIAHAGQMLAEGALIIDIGGESTRPGHQQISAEEEISRVVPVIRRLRAQTGAAISIDTYKPQVAQAALAAGADIINDIWGLQYPPDARHEMAALAAEEDCPVIAMFNREQPAEGDILSAAAAFLRRSMAIATAAGLDEEQLILDIGFGFGKTPRQNMQLLAQTAGLRVLGRPLLVAASRKSTLGALCGREVGEREFATAATTAQAVAAGAALVRVHNVGDNIDVIKICNSLK